MSIKRKTAKRPTKTDKAKGASLKDIAIKVVDTVTKPFKKKKPFGGKGGRKKKVPEMTAEQQAVLDSINADCAEDETKTETTSSVPSAINGFFYTDEQFVTSFEDSEILAIIRRSRPDFMKKGADDMHLRRSIVKLLDDDALMESILSRYSMSAADFIKFIYRQDNSIFTGSFISRLQAVMKGKEYAQSVWRRGRRH